MVAIWYAWYYSPTLLLRGYYHQNGENGVNARFFGVERCAEDYLLVWLRVGESSSLW